MTKFLDQFYTYSIKKLILKNNEMTNITLSKFKRKRINLTSI